MIPVGVFVTLDWRKDAGGHVKCWERFAEAAATQDREVDLTVHFLGKEPQTIEISENVRYRTHRPLLSTRPFGVLDRIAANTDLAPFHPPLLPYLKRYRVLHVTDLFSFGRTARMAARLWKIPLVMSLHTNLPAFTRLYSGEILRHFIGEGRLSRILLERFRLDRRFEALSRRRLEGFLKRCDRVLVSDPTDREWVEKLLPPDHVSCLRRGISKEMFHPRWRDRRKLREKFGIPEDRFLVLFAGRVDSTKGVMTLGRAVRLLLNRGVSLHLLVAGEGSERKNLQGLLGPGVTLTGVMAQEALPWLYASADLFVFPSQTETYGNVVIEARASGLPVIVSARGGAGQSVEQTGVDGVVLDSQDPSVWADAIDSLQRDPARRTAMGQSARRWVETKARSWETVLKEDLLPVWRLAAEQTT
jgi:glycosyltransferase involved in cell wall biosynthesis